MQVTFFRLVDMSRFAKLPIFAVPNAARRSPRQGAWMKAEGLRSGVPDVLCCVPASGHVGLALEFKAGTNQPTPAQQDWAKRLRDEGWRVVVVRSADEAWQALRDYQAL